MGFDGISVRWHSLVLGWIIKVGEVLTVMLHGKIGSSKAVREAIRSQERSGARL
jgi:hypothetical protein